MEVQQVPQDATTEAELAALLTALRAERKNRQVLNRRVRARFSVTERQSILGRTDGRCHVCGGLVGSDWQADHVLAHSGGGTTEFKNYLPAHPLCNNYRWDYLPAEFEFILKLGVYAKTQIKRRTTVGRVIANGFLKHELNRVKRRRP